MDLNNKKYIVSHDIGTSSDKAILISIYGEIIAIERQEYPMQHPEPGFAEQNPMDWWQAICRTTKSVLKKADVHPKDVVGITFSSLMQNLVPVNKAGEVLHPAITWLDNRGSQIMRDKLWTWPRVQGYNVFKLLKFLTITGGTPGQAGKDQIAKILWLKHYKPEVLNDLYKFLDAKDFIIYKLTGSFVTSVDLAVIWWLLDTRKNKNVWHKDLCKLADINIEQLPEVKKSSDIVGTISESAATDTGLLKGTPVINGAGDMTAAAIGSRAIHEGEMHISLGTSGWVGGHYRKRKIDIAHYTGCIGSAMPEKFYLGMAHQETSGLCLEWLKNNILYHEEQLLSEGKVVEIYQLLDDLAAQSPPGANGVIFTPWLYGERSPLDDDFVRAGLYNLSLQTNRADIIRAVLEGVAFNTRWAMNTLEKLYHKVDELNIIGGGAKSDIWCQIMANILNRKINQIDDAQYAGAKGMALLASKTLGYIDSYEQIRDYIKIKSSFMPNPENRTRYDDLFKQFKKIYKNNRKWYKAMNMSFLNQNNNVN
jgi:xylulokinase